MLKSTFRAGTTAYQWPYYAVRRKLRDVLLGGSDIARVRVWDSLNWPVLRDTSLNSMTSPETLLHDSLLTVVMFYGQDVCQWLDALAALV